MVFEVGSSGCRHSGTVDWLRPRWPEKARVQVDQVSLPFSFFPSLPLSLHPPSPPSLKLSSSFLPVPFFLPSSSIYPSSFLFFSSFFSFLFLSLSLSLSLALISVVLFFWVVYFIHLVIALNIFPLPLALYANVVAKDFHRNHGVTQLIVNVTGQIPGHLCNY